MYTANRANWTGLRLRVVSNPDFKMKKWHRHRHYQ
jgi:hypothetical protein